MDRFEGKRLNSPNDVVVKSDDSIWFTDMTAGIAGNWNGEIAEQELPQQVYRIDGKSGKATVVTDGLVAAAERAGVLARRKEALRHREPARGARDLCVRRAATGPSSPTARS